MAVSINHRDNLGWFPSRLMPDLSGQSLDQLYAANVFPFDLVSLSRLFWLSKAFDWTADISFVNTSYYNFNGYVGIEWVDTGTIIGSGASVNWKYAAGLPPATRTTLKIGFSPYTADGMAPYVEPTTSGSILYYGFGGTPLTSTPQPPPIAYHYPGQIRFTLMGQPDDQTSIYKYGSKFGTGVFLLIIGGYEFGGSPGGNLAFFGSATGYAASSLVWKLTIGGIEFDIPVFVANQPPPPLNNGRSLVTTMSGMLTTNINSFWT
jgi:hypothetical protein